jgi:predicted site-specific integrase-resolvase
VVTERDEQSEGKPEELVAIYTQVSSREHRANLERQASRLEDDCAAKGYRDQKVVKAIGSGVYDNRARVPGIAPAISA